MKANYPNNVYVQHDAEISNDVDLGVALDMFDDAHGLKFDALARAQYKDWLGVTMSYEERNLLKASQANL